MKGQVAQARSLTEQYTDFAELQQPGRAIGEVLVAHVAIAQGDFDTAVALLQRAAEVLEPTGYSWGSLALILLADALGQRGEATGAAKALSHAGARHGMKSALFAPELALARTWTRLAERDREGAISAVREAARTAEGGGQSAVALQAPHDAVRLGDPGDIDRIIRLAREVDCVASRLALAHGLAGQRRCRDAGGGGRPPRSRGPASGGRRCHRPGSALRGAAGQVGPQHLGRGGDL